LRVVVTRPELSAVGTAKRLKAMGHDPVMLPLSRAIYHPQTAAKALEEPYPALVATSAEALRAISTVALHPLIDFEKPLFAVGKKTAQAARSAGFLVVHAGSGDGAGLAELIAARLGGEALPLLYLAGRPRAETLETRLAKLGIPCRVAEIYEMTAVDYPAGEFAARLVRPDARAGARVGAVLLYSRETAIRFFDLLPADFAGLSEMRILCISERAASAVPAAFRLHLEIAESPDEDALLALL
jgi:uroporphyrinogen-III synthase